MKIALSIVIGCRLGFDSSEGLSRARHLNWGCGLARQTLTILCFTRRQQMVALQQPA